MHYQFYIFESFFYLKYKYLSVCEKLVQKKMPFIIDEYNQFMVLSLAICTQLWLNTN